MGGVGSNLFWVDVWPNEEFTFYSTFMRSSIPLSFLPSFLIHSFDVPPSVHAFHSLFLSLLQIFLPLSFHYQLLPTLFFSLHVAHSCTSWVKVTVSLHYPTAVCARISMYFLPIQCFLLNTTPRLNQNWHHFRFRFE